MENKMKKTYSAPSVEVMVLETKDVIAISGIFEDVDMTKAIGIGKIKMEMDLY